MSAVPSINPNTSLRGVVLSLPVKPIKAPVDLLCEIDQLVDAAIREGRMRQRDPDHYDYGDDPTDKIWPRVTEEVERLQGCEYDLGEILEATTALLLVLSQPKVKAVIASLGTHGPEAVERFCKAEAEAQKS